MVKTIAQARGIQSRRRAAGKAGIAAAVRRFLKRTGNPAYVLA